MSLCIGHILPKLISLKSGSDGWRRPGVSALSSWLFTYMIVCARLFEPPFPVTQPPAVSGTNARWQKQTLKIHPLKFYPTC